MILAYYAPKSIIVEIVDVLTCGNRKRALIRALAGEPFTKPTHGGPMDTDSALVNPDYLSGITQVKEAEPAYTGRRSHIQGRRYPVEWSKQNLGEFEGLFPSRYTDRTSTARGGINND